MAVTAAMARARHRGGAAVTYTTMPYYPMTYYHYDLPPTSMASARHRRCDRYDSITMTYDHYDLLPL